MAVASHLWKKALFEPLHVGCYGPKSRADSMECAGRAIAATALFARLSKSTPALRAAQSQPDAKSERRLPAGFGPAKIPRGRHQAERG